jgi:hypothetical protein
MAAIKSIIFGGYVNSNVGTSANLGYAMEHSIAE